MLKGGDWVASSGDQVDGLLRSYAHDGSSEGRTALHAHLCYLATCRAFAKRASSDIWSAAAAAASKASADASAAGAQLSTQDLARVIRAQIEEGVLKIILAASNYPAEIKPTK